MQEKSVNIRCLSRKDGKILEKVLGDIKEGTRILRVTRMGTSVHVYLEASFEEVWHMVKMEKVDTGG